MDDATLNHHAAAIADELGQIGAMLGQLEIRARQLHSQDHNLWTRVKNSIDSNLTQSMLSQTDLSQENDWTAAVQTWILPVVESRCPSAPSLVPSPVIAPYVSHSTPTIPHFDPVTSDPTAFAIPAMMSAPMPMPMSVPTAIISPPPPPPPPPPPQQQQVPQSPPFGFSAPAAEMNPFTASSTLGSTSNRSTTTASNSPSIPSYEPVTINPNLLYVGKQASPFPPSSTIPSLPDPSFFFSFAAPFPNGNILSPFTPQRPLYTLEEEQANNLSHAVPLNNTQFFSQPVFSEEPSPDAESSCSATPNEQYYNPRMNGNDIPEISIVRSETLPMEDAPPLNPLPLHNSPCISPSVTPSSRSRAGSLSRTGSAAGEESTSAGSEGHTVSTGSKNHHRRSISGGSVRAEPYPTSPIMKASDAHTNQDEDEWGNLVGSSSSGGRRSRRGSTASRHSNVNANDEDSSSSTNIGAGSAGRAASSGSRPGHGRSTSATSLASRTPSSSSTRQHIRTPGTVSLDWGSTGFPDQSSINNSMYPRGGTQSLQPSPSIALQNLSISSNDMASPSMPLFSPTPSAESWARAKSENENLRAYESASAGAGIRERRKLVIDPERVYFMNEESVFVLHTLEDEHKVIIRSKDIKEIELEEQTNDPSSALYQTVFNNRTYTPEDQASDVSKGQVYYFREKPTSPTASSAKKRTKRYHIAFSDPSGPTVSLVDEQGQLSAPSHTTTFIHFLPDSIVSVPTEPIGSPRWWRLPICHGKHLKPDLADGSWSGRFDHDKPRRPARLVEHYAECTIRQPLGDWDSLGKLARAVRKPGKGKVSRAKGRASLGSVGSTAARSSLGGGTRRRRVSRGEESDEDDGDASYDESGGEDDD